MKNTISLIADALLGKSIVNMTQLGEAKELLKSESIGLEDAIVKLGYATYPEITQCLSAHYGLAVIDLAKANILPEMIELIPLQIAQKYHILPVSNENGVITIAVSSPPTLEFLDNLRFMLNTNVKCVLAIPDDIKKAISVHYRLERTDNVNVLLEEIASRGEPINEAWIEQIGKTQIEGKEIEDEAPIIQLVTLIINKAIAARASDIHIEPFCKNLRIRYRIDGVCHEAEILPKRLQDSVISRVKILSNIDISEKRRPQDGRISVKQVGKEWDVRVSCLPSIYGESVVMRLLEKSSGLINIKNLGFYENDYKRFQSIIKKPNGILLITGPTGSGKTTTLYAVINELNSPDTKIITVEDPVEYTIHGVNQSEINEKIGFSFPVVMKTMLRHDPNIIMVGEIRDEETAETAVTAALTGHFVLSTLHTNDAPSTITRLIDMGIKPFLIATSLQGIMAQRLIRVICQHCKEAVEYKPEQLVEMGFEVDALVDCTLYKGNGCKSCNGVGYYGRIGIYELLDMNETIRDMTHRMASVEDIKKEAILSGMTTLREDGLRKAKDGKTTLEEIFRVTGQEGYSV